MFICKKKKYERITRTVYLASHYNIHIHLYGFSLCMYTKDRFHSYNNNITSLLETIILRGLIYWHIYIVRVVHAIECLFLKILNGT